jgi:hypothetical protein
MDFRININNINKGLFKMKKIISSLLIIIAAGLANTSLQADPVSHIVDYTCPSASALENFGVYIAGFGLEKLTSRTTIPIYFQSNKPLYNVPSSLVNYTNSGSDYDGPTGHVKCIFTSSNPYERSFDISYNITNGKGGVIQSKTNSTISVLFFYGLKY